MSDYNILAFVSGEQGFRRITVDEAVSDIVDTLAPLASPAFTGTPVAPTASAGTNTTQIATTAFVTTAISNVIDAAPGALDTLNELAAALGDDANFASTMTTSLAGKVAGPASATDNAIARYDGTTGKLVQDSTVSLSDTGNITGVNLLVASAARAGQWQIIDNAGGGSNWLIIRCTSTLMDFEFLNIVLTTSRTLTLSGDADISGTNTGDQTISLTGEVTGSGTGSFAATLGKTAITNRSADASPDAAADYVLIYDASADALKKVLLQDLPNSGYTDEEAQDAVGGMVDSSLVYTDGTPLLQRAALTGDVTAAAGSNATTIANNAVTFGKMQAVSANILLGNDAAGTAVEEITCTAAGRALLDDANAAAQRTTLEATTVGSNLFTLPNPSAITFIRINADNTVSALSDSDFRTAIGVSGSVPTQITVADTTDTTCFVALFESATGDLAPKTDGGLAYNAATGTLTATAFSGPLTGNVVGNVTGNVTGNVSGSSGSCTGNAATVTTNANLTGEVTSSGNAATLNINGLSAAEVAVADALPEYNAAATANRKITVGKLFGLLRKINGYRVTPQTGVSQIYTDSTAVTEIFLTSHDNDAVALYDGTRWILLTELNGGSDLSVKSTDAQTGTTHNGTAVLDGLTSTAQLVRGMKVTGTNVGAAAVITSIDSATQVTVSVNSTGDGSTTITFKLPASKMYNLFLVYNGGTPRLQFGNAWSDLNVQADSVDKLNGVKVNTAAVNSGDSNSIPANQGRLVAVVGTTATDGQTACRFGSGTSQAGGLWLIANIDNPVVVKLAVHDTTDGWNYTTDTVRQANAAAGNQVEFVLPYAGAPVESDLRSSVALSGNSARSAKNGIGVSSTTAMSGFWQVGYLTGTPVLSGPLTAAYESSEMAIGYHRLTWLEKGADGTCQFQGDNGSNCQSGMYVTIMA